MTDTHGTVHVTRAGAVTTISLERPSLNVLDRALDRALADAVIAAAADPANAVLVIDGGSARGFSAGVEVADHVPGKVEGMLADFHAAVRALWAADCVTLAAVHGFALGGGLELALACDLIIVEETARLGFPEIALGCYPPVAAAILPSRSGWAAACELVLTGEPFTPARAQALGLVNHVCRAGDLEHETRRRIAPLLERSPAVLREAKRALRLGAAHPPEATLAAIERRYLDGLMQLADPQEGVAAFLEKRPPRWENR
jgi:cyclohexa-1,5-dienecarbonyl-CoA hydratase